MGEIGWSVCRERSQSCHRPENKPWKLLFVYNQCADDTRHPATESKEEYYKDGPAPFVNDGKGRADDADYYTEAAHAYFRFANFGLLIYKNSLLPVHTFPGVVAVWLR